MLESTTSVYTHSLGKSRLNEGPYNMIVAQRSIEVDLQRL